MIIIFFLEQETVVFANMHARPHNDGSCDICSKTVIRRAKAQVDWIRHSVVCFLLLFFCAAVCSTSIVLYAPMQLSVRSQDARTVRLDEILHRVIQL